MGLVGLDILPGLIIAHMDPFYAECRAYGRIESKGRNGKVVVRCYGFITIPGEQQEELDEKFGTGGWERPEEDKEQAYSNRATLRAIVKELVPGDVSFATKMIVRMKADLKALRRMGVYVRDVRADNYKNGKLVDFSTLWTYPHIMLSERYWLRTTIERERDWELTEFDDMIKDSGLANPTWTRATPNSEYMKLRARGPAQSAVSEPDFEVEKILDKRTQRNRVQYLVRWKGFDPKDDQWLNKSELQNAKALVKDYDQRQPTSTSSRKRKRGRPRKKT